MITLININELYPHPDNPRKDIGDISELAESIKVSGILQNLTVVKGHTLSHDEWVDLSREYNKKPSEELRLRMNSRKSDDGYTVIIGHRRLAAAKLAGLTELPCVISEMDQKTQVGTMLLENMQRSDLTIYEQAQGFQMMIDFGDTIESISEKTGFSKSTVRRRVKLLDFDRDKLIASLDRGATLFDYEELYQIKDKALRDEVLDSIGTVNFRWKLNNALEKEKKQENYEMLINRLNTFAERVDSATGYIYIRYIDTDKSEIDIPSDAGERKYFYTGSAYGIQLYAEETAADIAADKEKERTRRAKDERISGLKELGRAAFLSRKKFIDEFSGLKRKQPLIMDFAARVMFNIGSQWSKFDYGLFEDLTSIKLDEDSEIDWDSVNKPTDISPERMLLVTAYCMTGDSESEKYYDWNGVYNENEDLDKIYAALEKLGYETSDEEKAWRDGTHEVYAYEG